MKKWIVFKSKEEVLKFFNVTEYDVEEWTSSSDCNPMEESGGNYDDAHENGYERGWHSAISSLLNVFVVK